MTRNMVLITIIASALGAVIGYMITQNSFAALFGFAIGSNIGHLVCAK